MRLANGRHEVIGVNADRRESDLDVIPEDVLALWRGKLGPVSQPAAVAGVTQAAGEALQPLVVFHVAASGWRRWRSHW